MLKLTRVNSMGLSYTLTEVFAPEGVHQTCIRLGDKQIVVNHSIHDINTAWYNWMMKSEYRHIQNAFPFLTPGEREFLITGITPDEWDEMFKEEEE